MDRMLEEHLEKKDVAGQNALEHNITNYQKQASQTGQQVIAQRDIDHEERIRQAARDEKEALERIAQRRREEQERHEEAKRELLNAVGRQMDEKRHRYDAITEAALLNQMEKLNKLDQEEQQMEKERIKLSEKSKEVEVRLTKANFDEVSAKKERHDKQREARAFQEQEKIAENQEKMQNMLKENRTQENQNALIALSQFQENANQLQETAKTVLTVSQNTYNNTNRGVINTKLQDIINAKEDLNGHYNNVHEVLCLLAEKQELKKAKRRNIVTTFQRCNDILSVITTELNNVNQLLPSFEMDGVDKQQEIREIKAKISAFSEVISSMKIRVENECEISPERVDKLKELKDGLWETLDGISLITEKRNEIVEQIQGIVPKAQLSLPGSSSAQNNRAIQN